MVEDIKVVDKDMKVAWAPLTGIVRRKIFDNEFFNFSSKEKVIIPPLPSFEFNG
jgi:hypothetical protein